MANKISLRVFFICVMFKFWNVQIFNSKVYVPVGAKWIFLYDFTYNIKNNTQINFLSTRSYKISSFFFTHKIVLPIWIMFLIHTYFIEVKITIQICIFIINLCNNNEITSYVVIHYYNSNT